MSFALALLTEDSGGQAQQTLERLVRHILHLLWGAEWQSRRLIDGLRFEPPDNPQARQALHGQRWRSTHPRDRQAKIDLARYLADRLLAREGVVVFHIDGDCPWSARPSASLAAFERFLEREVQPLLQARPAQEGRSTRVPRLEAVDLASVRGKLVLLVPYYSIEAWLYQNTAEVTALCEQLHAGRHHEQSRGWPALEEILKLKKDDGCCLKDQHNAALAGATFPARALYAAGGSFTETVKRFRACAPLLEHMSAST